MTAPEVSVKAITFGISSPDDIKARTEQVVTQSRNIDKKLDQPYSANCSTGGTTKRQELCKRCTGTMQLCIGHEPQIDPGIALINRAFAKELLLVVQSTCYYCGRLLLDADPKTEKRLMEKYAKDGHKRRREIAKISKLIGVCGSAKRNRKNQLTAAWLRPEWITTQGPPLDPHGAPPPPIFASSSSTTTAMSSSSISMDSDIEGNLEDEEIEATGEAQEEQEDDEAGDDDAAEDDEVGDEEDDEAGEEDGDEEDGAEKDNTKDADDDQGTGDLPKDDDEDEEEDAEAPPPSSEQRKSKKARTEASSTSTTSSSSVMACTSCGNQDTSSDSDFLERLTRGFFVIEAQKSGKGCGSIQPTYRRFDGSIRARFVIPYNSGATHAQYWPCMNPWLMHQRLRRMHPDAVRFLGFHPDRSLPSSMIWLVAPVLPKACRMAATRGDDKQPPQQDNLTEQYSRIVAADKKLRALLTRCEFHPNTLAMANINTDYTWRSPGFDKSHSNGSDLIECKCSARWHPGYSCMCMLPPGKTRRNDPPIPRLPTYAQQLAAARRAKGGPNTSNNNGNNSGATLFRLYDDLQKYVNCIELGETKSGNTSNTTSSNRHLASIAASAGGNKNERPIRSLKARLTGKTGRLRSSILGTRQDFSGRSVLTLPPDMPMDTVGIPLSMARTLTFRERVCAVNIHLCTNLLRLGYVNYVERDNGDILLCSLLDTSTFVLEEGMHIERHLLNGDWAVVNRQPTLHPPSMLGLRVWVHTGKSLLLPHSVMNGLAGDYDGDELTVIVPRDHESRAECAMLLHPMRHFLSSTNGRPVNGTNGLNVILAAFLLTSRSDGFSLASVQQMLMVFGVEEPDIPWDDTDLGAAFPYVYQLKELPLPEYESKNQWSGKQVFSLFLPTGIVYEEVVPKGSVTRSEFGLAADAIVHRIFAMHGARVTMRYLHGMHRVLHMDLEQYGATITREDYVLAPKCKEVCKQVLQQGLDASDAVIRGAQPPEYKVIYDYIQSKLASYAALDPSGKGLDPCNKQVPTKLDQASLVQTAWPVTKLGERETFIRRALDDVRSIIGQHTYDALMSDGGTTEGGPRGRTVRNGMIEMTLLSKSKGGITNWEQMSAMIGQCYSFGGRMSQGILPYFNIASSPSQAQGFVSSSFRHGTSLAECFMHGRASREGVADTVVKTSKTGYSHTKIRKSGENLRVQYDNTVRNAYGDVFSLSYGGDGFDPANCFTIKTGWVKYKSKSELAVAFCRAKYPETIFTQFVVPSWMVAWRVFVDLSAEPAMSTNRASLSFPIAFHRIHIHESIDEKKYTEWCLNTFRILQRIEIGCCEMYHMQDAIDVTRPTTLWLLFWDYLHPSRVHRSASIYTAYKDLDQLTTDLVATLRAGVAPPTSRIGLTAANSLGEPQTQMAMRTFHCAGNANKLTTGLPAFTQILSVSRTQNKAMSFFLRVKTQSEANIFTSRLPLTYLYHLVHKPRVELPNFDRSDVTDVWGTSPISTVPVITVSYMARQDALESRGMTLQDIVIAILWHLHVSLELEDAQLATQVSILVSPFTRRVFVQFMPGFRHVGDNLIPKAKLIVGRPVLTDNENREVWGRYAGTIYESAVVCGVQGIDSATLTTVDVHEWHPMKEEWVSVQRFMVQTIGSNLRALLLMKEVDHRYCITTNLHEINETQGLEAFSGWYADYLRETLNESAAVVDSRHFSVVSDITTRKGNILPPSRKGIFLHDSSVIRRTAFEQTVNNLVDAAAKGERDPLLGLTERLLIGADTSESMFKILPPSSTKSSMPPRNDMCWTRCQLAAAKVPMSTYISALKATYDDETVPPIIEPELSIPVI